MERATERERPKVHVLLCRWNTGKMPEGVDLEPLQAELARYRESGESFRCFVDPERFFT